MPLALAGRIEEIYMSKPTLFFSHSSKDKDMVLAIKNKVMQYTSGTLEIFQSSDGESIPFGTNWIHKVEEGLKEAKVMFVFITEQSISSGWIYFEAGYAYSKDVHVIPVGIGVSVGDLKAPLNLLQGFNITSADSLNNFLTIINREFNYSFSAQFTDDDFSEIISFSPGSKTTHMQFDEIVKSINYQLLAEYSDGHGGKVQYDIATYFAKIVNYLNENSIPYSLTDPYRQQYRKCIIVQGLRIIFEASSDPKQSINGRTERVGQIIVNISPVNFERSFDLYQKLSALLDEKERFYLNIRLNESYTFVTSDVNMAALLSAVPEWCSFSKNEVGVFECNGSDIHFCVWDHNMYDNRKETDYVLNINYDTKSVNAKDIVSVVAKLHDLHLIYKKQGD